MQDFVHQPYYLDPLGLALATIDQRCGISAVAEDAIAKPERW